jgi:hypothetical protein
LSQSTKTSSKGKRDGPTLAKPYTKKIRSDPSHKSNSGERNIVSPHNDQDDKELDYVLVTNQATNNIMEGKGTWEEYAITAQHCKAFYMQAFPPSNPHKWFDKPQSKSASMTVCRPKIEVDYIKYLIQNWDKGTVICEMEDVEDKKWLLNFCQKNKKGQKYIHQYYLEEVLAQGDLEPHQVLRRLEFKKEEGRIVEKDKGRIDISREELFDAINEWHHLNGHLGQERTWEYCRTKYWNVTQDHVKHYCMTCFTCMKKNPVTSKVKGSIKPTFSKSFWDRFQVDLIDFCRLKRDPFGVLMRWVMTLKDHATGLTHICALPRKQAHLIAYKLQEIFGFIGYPKIFHTDNGKEFTAKCVLQFLRNLNPNIVTVTGHPRCPMGSRISQKCE